MDTTTEYESITEATQLDALPEYTVLVAAESKLEGKTITMALQKFDGEWYSPGYFAPVRPEDLTPDFFPAKVVYKL